MSRVTRIFCDSCNREVNEGALYYAEQMVSLELVGGSMQKLDERSDVDLCTQCYRALVSDITDTWNAFWRKTR